MRLLYLGIATALVHGIASAQAGDTVQFECGPFYGIVHYLGKNSEFGFAFDHVRTNLKYVIDPSETDVMFQDGSGRFVSKSDDPARGNISRSVGNGTVSFHVDFPSGSRETHHLLIGEGEAKVLLSQSFVDGLFPKMTVLEGRCR